MGDETPTFEQWAIVELMGHVRLAGRVTEESHFGATLGRIDVPVADDEFLTQFFGGSSVYRITPVTEEAARQVARMARPAPIHRLELTPPPTFTLDHDDDDEDDDEDERY